MTNIEKLLDVMAALRDPQTGCPWDLRQDFASIAPYTLEEAYEVAEAIARDDLVALRDELGDLLFQVVFHARMAEERGAFDFDDVAGGMVEKLVRRHPHVFGSEEERRRGMQEGSWESIKAAERARDGGAVPSAALQGIAHALPALKRAQKLGKRAAGVGFDWPDAGGPWAKIAEEMGELRAAQERADAREMAEELGDLLFAIVNLARHLRIDAEQAASDANRKFEVRFGRMEARARTAGVSLDDLDADTLEAFWQEAKAETPDRA